MKTICIFSLLAFSTLAKAERKDEFLKNLNEKLKNGGTWKAKKSFDSIEEFRARRPNGVLLEPMPEPENYRKASNSGRSYNPPESFDAREKWDKCQSLKSVWDQSNCGSCWAVSSASVMSDRMCIHKNEQVIVSPEDILSCCSTCGNGCDGGWPLQAFKYWKNKGVVTGGFYGTHDTCKPYSIGPCSGSACAPGAETPSCVKKCYSEGYSTSYIADKSYAMTAYKVEKKVESIMEEIETNGPVTTTFEVYTDFYYYSSGVYKFVIGEYEGGHAVKVIGWGTEDDVPYWLIANSWGASWGEDGFFKIQRGTNECQIERDLAAGVPK